MSTISIEVDDDSAKVFAAASAKEKQKLQLLLRLRVRELTSGPPRSLAEVMDEIGTGAAAHGMTPEVLESLLNDD